MIGHVTALPEPTVDELDLTTVLGALADDMRLAIVRALAAGGEQACGTFELGISKATRSHHLRVLRESGLTHTRIDGTRRLVTLRRSDLDERFPGLLDAVLATTAVH
jgi:DNA-binding transcriptional ArsR family regulator